MKKKIIIPIIVCLIIIVGYLIWNNRTISTITLDINPSIEINLNKNDKVKNVIALNEEAKTIIDDNLKGKTLDDTLKSIANNLFEKGYAEERHITVLVYTEGNFSKESIENKISSNFAIKDIDTEIITIENITKEDKKIAKKYNISPAKAAYINSVSKDNMNLNIDVLSNKSVEELKETKDTGKYCDKDYTLEGDFCIKEIGRTLASNGKVCPREYYEYNGNCYAETRIEETDKLICRDEFALNEKVCSRTITINAEPTKYTCSQGESKTRAELGLTEANAGDANDIICVDLSSATHPVSPCELPANDPTERISSGGKCYWHRAPVIAEGCPGKIQVSGECWDDASNILICAGYRDGKQYSSRNDYCEHSIKYINPTVSEYKCPKDYTLKGDKCEKIEQEDATHEQICPNGYTKVDNDKCIDLNNTAQKENGLVCNGEYTRLRGNDCVTYEYIEAKR